jgi:hypothetical protein
MKLSSSLAAALALGALLAQHAAAQNFAASVVSYDPGADYALGFTHTPVVLGQPATVNPFGDAVTPFNSAYGTNDLLSIGTGGSLTLKFDRPIHNYRRPRQHGIDFIIFGNAGFIITNAYDPETYEWIGEPATDGSLFAANPGQTRVSVSRDGENFYVLESDDAPAVDTLFPTDAEGDPGLAVDRSLTAADFAGKTLADIRALYDGSAGGGGFDIAWAKRANGRPANLSFIRYVRIEVLSGKAEVDAVSAVTKSRR